MKRFIYKIFVPNKVIGFIFFNIGFGLLIYVFGYHLEGTIISYISYLLSTYALIIFIIWFIQVCKFGSSSIKRSKVYKKYQDNYWFVTRGLLYLSLVINLIYGLFNLGTGIYYKSWWFITFAIYYLLLCFMKFSLVKDTSKHANICIKDAYKKLRNIGITLLLLDIILTGIIILIINYNQVIRYNGTIIYIVALYDFYLIIVGIVNVIRYRKNNNPILIASKCINLTVAMISMISLEVAMVYQFGNNDSYFKSMMTSSMGFVICIVNTIMAIDMIIKGSKGCK